MVLEYLAHAGYERAASALKVQIKERRAGKKSSWRPVGKDVRAHVKTRMMKALDRGERDEVLRLWENFVPPLVRRTDRNSQKLEFYLNIFFAIYPVHPVNPSRKTAGLAPAMGRFKEFLEGDGAPLAVTPEFLAYHAMPYVPEIAAHPSFKDLFTKEWAAALKTRLSEYLAASEQFAATPRLLEICGSYRGLGVQQTDGRHPVDRAHGELQALKDRLVESELRALESKQQLAAHEAAYSRSAADAFALAQDAVDALGGGRGAAQLRDLQARLGEQQARINALPVAGTAVGSAVGLGGGGGGGGYSPPPQDTRRLDAPPMQPARSPRSTVGGGGGGGGLGATQPPLAALNFAKLRSAIADGASAPAASAAADDAAVVLQALRWRLTKTARRQRRSALQQYMRNSLLDAPTLSALLDANAPPPLREQALRLVNLFASEAAGRTYLLAQPDLVPNLCALLSVEAADTIGRQNTLGALQKLSLRRAPQNSMIDCGVIAWLVEVLADTDSLSQYSVEFGTALLMNLSLRTAGKAKCAADDSQILDVLSQLMENDSLQVRTYVNGTLYSILVKAALKEKALEIGLPDSLRALIEHSDETFARQINYILEQLEKPPVADDDGAASDGEDADDDEEEPDEDDDGEDEEEVDVFAEVALPLDSTDGLSGEELLAANYLAAVQEAQRDASAAAADDAARREQAAQQAARRRQQEEAEAAAEAEAGGDPKPRHRIHDPDEPLQRPSTPSQTAMKAATNASRASLVDPPPLGEDGIPEPVSYPDPGQIPDDQYEAVFQMRARMPRTPQSGVRPDLPEIKPALTRSDRRASSQDAKGGKPTARPSQRRPPKAPTGGGGDAEGDGD